MPTLVEHIVLLKVARPLSEAELTELRSLITGIPGVLRFSAGPNYTSRGQVSCSDICRRASVEHTLHVEHCTHAIR